MSPDYLRLVNYSLVCSIGGEPIGYAAAGHWWVLSGTHLVYLVTVVYNVTLDYESTF